MVMIIIGPYHHPNKGITSQLLWKFVVSRDTIIPTAGMYGPDYYI